MAYHFMMMVVDVNKWLFFIISFIHDAFVESRRKRLFLGKAFMHIRCLKSIPLLFGSLLLHIIEREEERHVNLVCSDVVFWRMGGGRASIQRDKVTEEARSLYK